MPDSQSDSTSDFTQNPTPNLNHFSAAHTLRVEMAAERKASVIHNVIRSGLHASDDADHQMKATASIYPQVMGG